MLGFDIAVAGHDHRMDLHRSHAWSGNSITAARIFGGRASRSERSVIPALPLGPCGRGWCFQSLSCHILWRMRHRGRWRSHVHWLSQRLLDPAPYRVNFIDGLLAPTVTLIVQFGILARTDSTVPGDVTLAHARIMVRSRGWEVGSRGGWIDLHRAWLAARRSV